MTELDTRENPVEVETEPRPTPFEVLEKLTQNEPAGSPVIVGLGHRAALAYAKSAMMLASPNDILTVSGAKNSFLQTENQIRERRLGSDAALYQYGFDDQTVWKSYLNPAKVRYPSNDEYWRAQQYAAKMMLADVEGINLEKSRAVQEKQTKKRRLAVSFFGQNKKS